MDLVCFNGEFYPGDQPLLTASNRSFKWGDGIFETMKIRKNRILLESLHFERLFLSMKLLGMKPENLFAEHVTSSIHKLCELNGCSVLARVRLAVFRNNNKNVDYLIEAIPLSEESMSWNEQGLSIGLYPFARKSTDAFANIKSSSFLPYVLASHHAKENGWDDALVLNCHNLIADSSRANIFWIRKGVIHTPPLIQGCINGVMRRFLMESAKKNGQLVKQEELSESELLLADEVFLTNAIQGIRWVRSYKAGLYGHEHTLAFYNNYLSTIYS